MGCCDSSDYGEVFGGRFARAQLRRYRKRGLDRTAARMVELLRERGLEGATVLEIGGGVGDLHVELLRHGASRATNLELVDEYDEPARRLAADAGVGDRVERRSIDIATRPDEVEAADVVVMHRVVCCYPDHEALVGAAARHARQVLVFSHPRPNLLNRAMIGLDNTWRRVRGNSFRAFVHPPEAMLATARHEGLTPTYHHRGRVWEVVALQRAAA